MKLLDEINLDYKTLTWSDLFDSHEELVNKMKEVNIIKYKSFNCTWSNRIVDLQVSLMIKPYLSKKETKVIQSLAGEIHKYHKLIMSDKEGRVLT